MTTQEPKPTKGSGRPKGMKKSALKPVGRKKISKNVNTPGEGQRAFQGKIDQMISKAEGDFNKMIKNWRAKTRS